MSPDMLRKIPRLLDVKPGKIVAGLEAEFTNKWLVAMAKCARGDFKDAGNIFTRNGRRQISTNRMTRGNRFIDNFLLTGLNHGRGLEVMTR